MLAKASALLVLAFVGAATGCEEGRDRSTPVATRAEVEPTPPASVPGAVAPPAAPRETVPPPAPRETVPPPAPQPAAPTPSAPPPPPPAPPPPVVIVVPPSLPQVTAPIPAPFAPYVQPTTNDAGILVPAVPLFLDPGAPPGAPGNGAPEQ